LLQKNEQAGQQVANLSNFRSVGASAGYRGAVFSQTAGA
jgi:hypothetical protein